MRRYMTLLRFYWLVEDGIAGCSLPGGAATRTTYADQSALAADLSWLQHDRGISSLLTLTERPLDAVLLATYGIEALHVPIEDLAPPTPEQFQTALYFIDRQRSQGKAVAVHCLMGQGRTGSILAAYLIRNGMSPGEALHELRVICPGAVENPAQEQALRAFAARRDWVI
jgi:atypical dual specificity phosphatase